MIQNDVRFHGFLDQDVAFVKSVVDFLVFRHVTTHRSVFRRFSFISQTQLTAAPHETQQRGKAASARIEAIIHPTNER